MRLRVAVTIVPALLAFAHVSHAAIAIDVTSFADRSTPAATIATPSFSTAAGNELLLAFIAADDASVGGQRVNGVSGAGATWQLVVRAATQRGISEIWRTFAPSRVTAASVTATLAESAAASITLVTFTGVDSSGTNGSGAIGAVKPASAASGAPNASLITTRDNSWVFGVGNDWSTATARTVGPGQTMVHQYLATVGDTLWVQRMTSATPLAGTTVTINDTAPAFDQYNLAICEILSASAPPASLTVSMTAPASGADVLGTTTVSATASDTSAAIAGVQFQVDGTNLGSEATASPYSMSWNTTSVADGSHQLTAVARNSLGSVATSAPVSVNVANGIASTGRWGQPFDLGLVAVNTILLHTGKVLMYLGTYTSSFVERLWDPVTGAITMVPNPYFNLFCSGHSQLADGRILVVGGYDPPSLGAANANIFDPVTQTWSALPNMAYRRWYPTATTLPDGRVLVTSGGQTCLTCLADIPEVFDPATGQFSRLASARLAVPYYPFMFVLPDGSVIDAGASENPVATSRLNVASQTWTTVDPVVRDGHTAAMYAPGRIMKSGTAADSGTSGTAAATVYVLDTAQPSPAWRQVAPMANRRAFHNSTILPDGTVLITGGGTTLDGYDVTKAVYAAELWSPSTERWQTLAAASIPRLYHSIALLLPDGRVLSAGGGNDAGAVDQTQGQLYSPPYLFKGSRPVMASAPGTLQYGATFVVQTPDPGAIAAVSLVRPGAVTHAFDEDQRFLSLDFTAAAGSLTITAPANANLAPPGYYMLFLLNASGVPSIASFVRLPSPSQDSVAPTPPAQLSAQGGVGLITLTWNAATDNTGVASYNVHRSTSAGAQPTLANRIGPSASTTFTDQVSAGTYFYVVTAQDVAGNVSAPSNEAMAVLLSDTTAPTVALTAPAAGATVSGTVTVTADASDDVGVAGVQFKLDGVALGAERPTRPYSTTWNTATASNGIHTLSAAARDAAGNSTQAGIDVTVSNTSQQPSGLVAAYGFNEGNGVQTADTSGQANTGTLSGATWTTAGKFGRALSFNGTSAWVTVADANSLDLTNGMTLEAWVNPSTGSGWRSVVVKEGSISFTYALYATNTAGRPAGFVRFNQDVDVTAPSALALNTWTHLAVTFNGTTLRFYVNGILAKSKAASGATAPTPGALRLGGNAIWGEYFRGLIDEVRIYNRALSAAEIQADMSTPIP